METKDKLIPIRTCNDQFEAEVLRARLQSEGIDAVTHDCNPASYLLSPYGTVGGRVELLVREADVDKAEQALQ